MMPQKLSAAMRWLRNISKSNEDEYVYAIRGTVLHVGTRENSGDNAVSVLKGGFFLTFMLFFILMLLGSVFQIAFDIITREIHYVPPDTGYPFADVLKVFIPLLQHYPEFASPIMVTLLCFGMLLSAIILGGGKTATCLRIRGYQIDVRKGAPEPSETDPAPAQTVFFLHLDGPAWPPVIAGDEIKALCVAYGRPEKKHDNPGHDGLISAEPYVLPYTVCRLCTYAMAESPHPNAQRWLPVVYAGKKQPTKGAYDERQASFWR
jgi:hypothetical protein